MNPIKVVKLAELNDISERNIFITQLNGAIPTPTDKGNCHFRSHRNFKHHQRVCGRRAKGQHCTAALAPYGEQTLPLFAGVENTV